MAKVGIGIIGTGSIAGAHLRAYARYPELCRVVAVADIDRQRAQKFAAGAGDSVAAYGDYKELLRRDDIDAVSICTPPFAHAEIAVAALNAGKHVLVEKPMAASLAEADAMLAAAEQNVKKLAVVFQNRWRHDWMRAKALIDGEHLGRILFGKGDCLWWRGDEYYDMWWRGTWEQECGGATINHAIHHIDAFLWLMGEPVGDRWMGAVDHDIEVEDLSMAIVRFRAVPSDRSPAPSPRCIISTASRCSVRRRASLCRGPYTPLPRSRTGFRKPIPSTSRSCRPSPTVWSSVPSGTRGKSSTFSKP